MDLGFVITSCEDTEPHVVHAIQAGVICIGRGPVAEKDLAGAIAQTVNEQIQERTQPQLRFVQNG